MFSTSVQKNQDESGATACCILFCTRFVFMLLDDGLPATSAGLPSDGTSTLGIPESNVGELHWSFVATLMRLAQFLVQEVAMVAVLAGSAFCRRQVSGSS